MEGYGIIMQIILGGVAGWLAEKVMGFNTGLIMNIILGIVGAVVGNFFSACVGVGPWWASGPADRRSARCLCADPVYRAIKGRA
jgi:uncharacterized membrane protein YeaQ/YmgE (transglycosylase-associated protein family)